MLDLLMEGPPLEERGHVGSHAALRRMDPACLSVYQVMATSPQSLMCVSKFTSCTCESHLMQSMALFQSLCAPVRYARCGLCRDWPLNRCGRVWGKRPLIIGHYETRSAVRETADGGTRGRDAFQGYHQSITLTIIGATNVSLRYAMKLNTLTRHMSTHLYGHSPCPAQTSSSVSTLLGHSSNRYGPLRSSTQMSRVNAA
jgi:hypothetical protein